MTTENTHIDKSMGWVPLPRTVLDNGLLRDHKLFIFLAYCQLKTTHKQYQAIIRKMTINLLPGQFIFGRKKASEETGLSEGVIRSCITQLKKSGDLTIKSTSRFSVITVEKLWKMKDRESRTTTYKRKAYTEEKKSISVMSTLHYLGIQYKKEADEIRINCLFCGDSKKHLYINPDKKVFKCQKCGAEGHWSQLHSKLDPSSSIETCRVPARCKKKVSGPVASTTTSAGMTGNGTSGGVSGDNQQYKVPKVATIDKYHEELYRPKGQKALQYLYSRTFTDEAIKHFRLGIDNKFGKVWLTIPYLRDGIPVNVKYRNRDKDMRRWPDAESILFNQDCLKTLDSKEVILVEGELDVVALYSQGYRNVVSSTTGANSFKSEWIDLLREITKIFIVYDSDEVGQAAARKLAIELGVERCRNILLPVKDANDFFMAGNKRADFQTLIERAACFT